MHLVRSMSRYSQGVLARELLNRPCRPGVSLPSATIVSLTCCSVAQAEVAAVLDHQLEAAGGAQAVDRRGAEDDDHGVADLSLAARRGARRRWRRPSGRPRRSANSSSITYIEPRFGALAFSSSDWPEMPTVWSTPGRVAGDVVRSGAITSWVRSTEAESGSCTLTSR